MNQALESLKEFNREIRQELISDGSDPEGIYIIEHHFSAEDFDQLEKAAMIAFKLGFEVTDAEQIEDDEGAVIFSFDLVTEKLLDVVLLDAECETMLDYAQQWGVEYDGWGTYFVDPEGEEEG
ncbi:ribonuclease E inhibitor RraB [Echinimonas agarilytica]|uniref:Regulator of ribonuclease activity B n=1 Tax=Echinimonas agarilytica TaxID=1215918 RepID=A0AA41W934_9GAMM|nr:ribonuclease E inhibitor RraB [Echinimonas agarilytica]MCM2680399.1 ribonuclease E inhibitor RraB [Echinimonas agarilytica]